MTNHNVGGICPFNKNYQIYRFTLLDDFFGNPIGSMYGIRYTKLDEWLMYSGKSTNWQIIRVRFLPWIRHWNGNLTTTGHGGPLQSS